MRDRALWVRSLRGRPLIVVLLFALSAAAVLTSALGPLLVRAVHQSSLGDAVEAAGPAGTSIVASVDLERGDDIDAAVGQVVGAVAGAGQGPAASLWQSPQLSVQTTSNIGWTIEGAKRARQGGETVSRVASGEDGCARLTITVGACPARAGETMVSVTDAGRSGTAVGRVLLVPVSTQSGSTRTVRLRVVGLYDPDRSISLDLLRPSSLEGQLAQVDGDPLVTTRAQLVALNVGSRITGRLVLAGTLDAQQEPAARASSEQVKAATLAVSDRLVVFDSRLPQLLDDVDRRVASASVLMLVTVVQAEVLALFALVIALQRLGRSRSAEWGVGRLRGMPRRVWLRSIWAEPAVALLLGLPVGLAGAVGLGTVVVGRELRAGTPVESLRWTVLLAAVAAAVVALVALIAVSLRDLRRPLIELLQQASDSRRVSLVGVVAQSAVVLLAAAALYQLLAGGVLSSRGSQLALLAPALFAFAAAVLAVRVTVVVVRRVSARAPRSLLGLVVGRHAARSPSTLTPAMVVAAGLALAVFSTQVLALSVRNQGLRAQAIVGADTVLQVARPDSVDLVAAVRAADPTGRYAMAVQEKAQSSDGGTSRIVAVDASRLDAVAPWMTSWVETQSLSHSLHTATTAPVLLQGSEVELTTTDVVLKVGRTENAPVAPGPPTLSLVVQAGSGGAWQRVDLGELKTKPARYTAPLPCADGCRLVGINLYVGTGHTYEATFTINALSTDRDPASTLAPRLQDPTGWRERIGQITGPDRVATLDPAPGPGGLRIRASDTTGDNDNRAVPTDSDDPLPAVVAPGLVVQPFPGMASVAAGTGLDGQSQLIKVVGRAAILPRALDDGVLVDLANASSLSNPADDEATSEVWLTRTAPASVEEQLTREGIVVLSREHLDDTRQVLLQQGNTRGALAAVWVAAAGLLITLLTLIGARAADADRRRRDWLALQDSGVAPTATRLLAFVEIAAPALLGALIGLASGVVAVTLGASRLPLVDVYAPGPPLDLHLAWPPLAWLAASAAVVTLAVAAVGSHLETSPTKAQRAGVDR